MRRRRFGRCAGLAALALLAACGTRVPGTQVTVFGERHDQVDQQRQVAQAVGALAARGGLRAVVLEMADRGTSTAGLTPRSTEDEARAALAWSDRGWPWVQYGPVVMAAVRAGVTVWGGNLPRGQMREAMVDPALDQAVPESAAARLDAAILDGHCGLLPTAMVPGMRRIQVARDQSMAAVIAERLAEGPGAGQVLLLTGAQHASRDRGVPWHLVHAHGLPAAAIRVVIFDSHGAGREDGLAADERPTAALTEGPDPCEAMRRSRP